jgi:hypothetical protein
MCDSALAVGCRKCPVFRVCPVKGVIGDYKIEQDAKPGRNASKAKRGGKRGG